MVIQTPKGDKIECMIRLDFPTTNNEAEYEALVAGLDLAKAVGAENVVVHCDSQVVTNRINGGYEYKNKRMKRYLEKVKNQISSLEVRFVQIPKGEIECMIRLDFPTTNNKAEYEALAAGLDLVKVTGVENVVLHDDS